MAPHSIGQEAVVMPNIQHGVSYNDAQHPSWLVRGLGVFGDNEWKVRWGFFKKLFKLSSLHRTRFDLFLPYLLAKYFQKCVMSFLAYLSAAQHFPVILNIIKMYLEFTLEFPSLFSHHFPSHPGWARGQ